jgi:bacterioferritin (cytochrome b1)
MPENLDLTAAARSMANADEIIKSVQVLAHIPHVQDDDTRTLVRRLFETLVHQNEVLESLRLAIAKLDNV